MKSIFKDPTSADYDQRPLTAAENKAIIRGLCLAFILLICSASVIIGLAIKN